VSGEASHPPEKAPQPNWEVGRCNNCCKRLEKEHTVTPLPYFEHYRKTQPPSDPSAGTAQIFFIYFLNYHSDPPPLSPFQHLIPVQSNQTCQALCPGCNLGKHTLRLGSFPTLFFLKSPSMPFVSPVTALLFWAIMAPMSTRGLSTRMPWLAKECLASANMWLECSSAWVASMARVGNASRG
jgi:hypothetical protein